MLEELEILMFYMKIGTEAGTLDKIAGAIGIVVGFLLGEWGYILTALIILQVTDTITGLLVGGNNGELSSRKMREGIKKKIAVWIALVLGHVVDMVLFDGQPVALTGLAYAFVANEGLSIVENLGNLGLLVPEFLAKYLEQIRNRDDISELKIGNPDKTIEDKNE